MIAAAVGTVAVGCAVSLILVRVLRPLLVRYALARPNARSSHSVPTPQGGGIAVLAGALAAAACGFAAAGAAVPAEVTVLAGAGLVLALLGLIDDIRPLGAAPRLLVQFVCVGGVIAASGTGRILPEAVPPTLEWALLTLAGTWWVNLVNFMDGIDWMTVAQGVPLTAAILLLGLAGALGPAVLLVAAALLGGLLGFAPANRPVAGLFLGDVGSLPIGLLTGWLLLHLAGSGGVAAALLLGLYYLADATLTLLLRLRRGERLSEAHRSHFYQRALGNGLSVAGVDARVAALNVALACLAAATLQVRSPALDLLALVIGAGLVAVVLRRFAHPRRFSARRGVIGAPPTPPGGDP
ncbi:MAG: glycosyl transferase [Enterovirga sp.]|nr:glycosyl transferase [Enterovirga sp.]